MMKIFIRAFVSTQSFRFTAHDKMISRLFLLLLMIFLEDVVLGTFLRIFTVFFGVDIFNSSVGES